MVFPTLFWILAVVSAVLCCIGFYRFVWFMSVGYGLAVAGCGAALLIAGLIGGNFSIPYLLLCVLLVIYGCRLGLFLLIREMKSAAYKKTLDGAGGLYSGCIFRGFCGTDDAQILLSDAQVRLCHAGGGHH